MGNLGEEQSESEESVYEVATRRENASDDDDDNGNSEGEARERLVWSDWRFRVGYREESDGLGLCDDYDAVSCFDELEVLGDEQLVMLKEEEDEEEVEEDFGENECEEWSCEKEVHAGVKQGQEEESVAPVDPRNGAFYMHDDRFRGGSRGSRRWMLDERFRALCDEPKWKHDKFELMKVQETYDNKFNSFAEVRGLSEQYHRGHPKNRGKSQHSVKAYWSKTNDNINNQNYCTNVVRGRGPIKYKRIMRSSNSKQSMRPQGHTSNTSSRRVFSTKDVQYSIPLEMRSSSESARPRTFKMKKSREFLKEASNTDSVRVSSQLSKKQDTEPGKAFRCAPTAALPNHHILVPWCNSLLQGKTANNLIGRDKFYADNFIHPPSESYLPNLPLQSSISWPTYSIASPQMMAQRNLPFSTMLTHQLTPTTNQVYSVYPQAQHPIVQQIPVERRIRHPSLSFTRQLNQSYGSGAQTSSESLLPNSYEPVTPRSLTSSSKSKLALGGKEISTLHGKGRGSLLSAETRTDKNITDTASLFPAMQHGCYHNGELGEPAVSMAVAGYLSQSQNTFGNPEITWFPDSTAAAGTVGSAYRSPRVPAKGGYTAHATGESSSYRVTRYSRMNINKQRE